MTVVLLIRPTTGTSKGVAVSNAGGGGRPGTVVSRGSGASGARVVYGLHGSGGRSGSLLKPDGGARGFLAGGSSAARRPGSGFVDSVRKARDQISYSMKNIFRPKAKVPRPTVSRPISAIYNPAYMDINSDVHSGAALQNPLDLTLHSVINKD